MSEPQNLKPLDENKYDSLIEAADNEVRKNISKTYLSYRNNCEEKWAYQIYCNSPCESKKDLIKVAGMVYAWMPRMIRFHFDKKTNWGYLIDKIKNLEKENDDIRKDIMKNLSINIDHSIVAASKALHFINPGLVPIIDSRVAKGWNIFFKTEIKNGTMQELPKQWSFYTKDSSRMNKQYSDKADKYIYYWNTLLKWKNNINSTENKGVSIRDLEFPLYCIGEKSSKKKE